MHLGSAIKAYFDEPRREDEAADRRRIIKRSRLFVSSKKRGLLYFSSKRGFFLTKIRLNDIITIMKKKKTIVQSIVEHF